MTPARSSSSRKLVATLTLGRGRTTIVQGVIHLVIFATYLFVTIVP